MTQPLDTPHVSAERLAAFLDRRLTPVEHEDAIAHFAECATCRREMTALRRVIAASHKRPFGLNGPLLALAAAVLTIAFIPRLVSHDDPSPLRPTSSERARQPDLASRVEVVDPPDGATIDASGIVLRWRSAGSEATYRVIVQDSTGSLLWEATVGDTVVTLPGPVALAKGRRYFWSVDAQLIDGRAARARVHQFVTK